MSKIRKELKVSAIENGTVIDHIPTKSVFQVIRILNLNNIENQVLFSTNLDSKKYGKKGLIKVSGKYFKPEEVNKIALVAPTATLIEIKDYKVKLKKSVEIPKQIFIFVKCVNPNCITNYENITTKFDVSIEDNGDIKLWCKYCDKYTAKDNIVFI